MIYYQDQTIVVRDLQQNDIPIIVAEEIAQGWHATAEKYETRLQHQAEGRAIAMVAEFHGQIAGYINLYLSVASGPFCGTEMPEIVDFGVLEKYRCHGIGTKLMDTAESLAKTRFHSVCLSVGVHNGYGSAQRMYVKRGYVPDGTGVWYGSTVCEPYTACCNDDDLVLFFSKKLQ